MPCVPPRAISATTLVACVLAIASTASAQSVELTPFEGYRFGGGAFACAPGVCLIHFNPDVFWQIEFTAGLILRFR